jgi:OmpA-OmpF porin, OOP family
MASLVEDVMASIGSIATPMATSIGESTDFVRRGLEGGAAAILSGLAERSKDSGFLNQIFGLIANPANSESALAALVSNPTGADSPLPELSASLLPTIFGSRVGALTDMVGRSSGLGAEKAKTLLSVAAPLVLGVLGRFVRNSHGSASSLGAALMSETPKLAGFLPAGLTSLFRGGVDTAAGVSMPSPVQSAATTNRWLWPVVLLAGLLLTGLWFFHRAAPPVSDAVQTVTDTGRAAATGLGDFFKTHLPDGAELNIPQFGIENKLLSFIKDTSKAVDDTTWFDFDRLLFDTGKATLNSSSDEQLNNIAEILRAYPHVHVKIGGYTDNTGDPAANQTLSEARAKTVVDSLTAKGIDPSRLTSEGYGDQHPVADNSTEEGRAKNRRIALRVTQK